MEFLHFVFDVVILLLVGTWSPKLHVAGVDVYMCPDAGGYGSPMSSTTGFYPDFGGLVWLLDLY